MTAPGEALKTQACANQKTKWRKRRIGARQKRFDMSQRRVNFWSSNSYA